MFWGLASGEVDPRQFEFEHVLRDIQTLNEWALRGKLEVTAISLAAYPPVQEEWWLLDTGLPLPLGANVARRDLGASTLFDVSDVLRESIQAGLDNREEAMEHALQYGRGLDTELADRFVGMYVNELTCDYGEEGRQAVREVLSRAEKLGAYEQPVRVEFVG